MNIGQLSYDTLLVSHNAILPPKESTTKPPPKGQKRKIIINAKVNDFVVDEMPQAGAALRPSPPIRSDQQ
jgi:hypothetical protein